MAEYIERDALIRQIKLQANRTSLGEMSDPYMTWQDVVRLIVEAPAADVVEVKRGRWVQVICHVEFEDGFVDRLYECCSRCHKPNGRKMTDYCPNCGARMDGADVKDT